MSGIDFRMNGTCVFLVHGGGMTGSCWESTPDGLGDRKVISGIDIATCTIDMVERGRAGFSAIPGTWQGRCLHRSGLEA